MSQNGNVQQLVLLSASSSNPFSTRIINPLNKNYVWQFRGQELQNGVPQVLEPIGEIPDSFFVAIHNTPLVHMIGFWNKQRQHVKAIVPGHISAVCTDPSGNFIIAAIAETLHVWSSLTRELINIVKSQFLPITCLKASCDGKFVVSGAEDGTVVVHELTELVAWTKIQTKAEPFLRYTQHSAKITDLHITSSNQPRILSVCANHTAIVYSIYAKCLLIRIVEDYPIFSCCMDPAESKIFLGLEDGNITVASLSKKQLKREEQFSINDSLGPITRLNKKHSDRITKLAVSFDGSILVSCDVTGQYNIWDIPSGSCFATDSLQGPIITAKFIQAWPSVFDSEFIPPKPNSQSFHKQISSEIFNIPAVSLKEIEVEKSDQHMKNALQKLLDNMQKENQSNNASEANDTTSAELRAQIATLQEERDALKKANVELYDMCQNLIVDD
uniref:WD repeat-containing protein 18 n=1 Tax=Panagrolaimus sp. JU765 TaxID=591449 RepID=A0AC34QZH8_9BILA